MRYLGATNCCGWIRMEVSMLLKTEPFPLDRITGLARPTFRNNSMSLLSVPRLKANITCFYKEQLYVPLYYSP